MEMSLGHPWKKTFGIINFIYFWYQFTSAVLLSGHAFNGPWVSHYSTCNDSPFASNKNKLILMG